MLLTLLLGNLLHLVYDWTGQASWAAYISAVNESTWEHMKLLAVPWILWTAVTILIERRADCAAPRAAGLLTGLILIPALFYTYTGICGKSVDVVNVLIFQAAVLAAWLVSRGLQRRGSSARRCGRCWAFWCSWAQPRSSPCGRSIRRSCPFCGSHQRHPRRMTVGETAQRPARRCAVFLLEFSIFCS